MKSIVRLTWHSNDTFPYMCKAEALRNMIPTGLLDSREQQINEKHCETYVAF